MYVMMITRFLKLFHPDMFLDGREGVFNALSVTLVANVGLSDQVPNQEP